MEVAVLCDTGVMGGARPARRSEVEAIVSAGHEQAVQGFVPVPVDKRFHVFSILHVQIDQCSIQRAADHGKSSKHFSLSQKSEKGLFVLKTYSVLYFLYKVLEYKPQKFSIERNRTPTYIHFERNRTPTYIHFERNRTPTYIHFERNRTPTDIYATYLWLYECRAP